jgi:hypothetical protein
MSCHKAVSDEPHQQSSTSLAAHVYRKHQAHIERTHPCLSAAASMMHYTQTNQVKDAQCNAQQKQHSCTTA